MATGPLRRLFGGTEPDPVVPPAPAGVELLYDRSLHTRWYILHRLQEELDRSRRYYRPLAVLIAAPTRLPGERVSPEELEVAAAAARSAARTTDLIGWLSEDSFLILLPEVTAHDIETVLSRWRNQMWLRARVLGGHKWAIFPVDNPAQFETVEECIQTGLHQVAQKEAA